MKIGGVILLAGLLIAACVLADAALVSYRRHECIRNLSWIDEAKQNWALENGKKSSDTPTVADLLVYANGHRDSAGDSFPTCPSGGTYTINSLGQVPTCSVSGHAISRADHPYNYYLKFTN